jgi:hypothetical protein
MYIVVFDNYSARHELETVDKRVRVVGNSEGALAELAELRLASPESAMLVHSTETDAAAVCQIAGERAIRIAVYSGAGDLAPRRLADQINFEVCARWVWGYSAAEVARRLKATLAVGSIGIECLFRPGRMDRAIDLLSKVWFLGIEAEVYGADAVANKHAEISAAYYAVLDMGRPIPIDPDNPTTGLTSTRFEEMLSGLSEPKSVHLEVAKLRATLTGWVQQEQ